MTERELILQIEALFPAHRPDLSYPLAESHQGDEPELVRQVFADKTDWTAIETSWLDLAPDGYASALSFLSSEAVCFYIPAYLRADIRGELLCADPLFALTHGFDNATRHARIWPRKPLTWNARNAQRWSRLTSAQCGAVCAYLEWRLARDEHGTDFAAAEALENYWRKRANL